MMEIENPNWRGQKQINTDSKYFSKHVSITFLKSNFILMQVFKKILLVFHRCQLCWRESPMREGQEA